MLGDKSVTATVAVKDLEAAKAFYEGILGLTSEREDLGGILYRSGDTRLFVYPSEYAGTNKATAAGWGAGEDIGSIVEALQARGVTFETYDMPGSRREGPIHIIGELKAAWFRDPDGNIFSIVNQM
jgi:catechol 2,3-dioxygenase-like lactoylglutathione lyase family enzyme